MCIPAGLPPDMPCPPGEWLRDGECIAAGVPPDGCARGFVHDGDRGCEPILPAQPCAPGLMAVPGERNCREVAPCASGQWGDIPIEPDTEHVDASYAGMDSDGTALKPWTTVQSAVNDASPGAIVAIAAGSYDEDVTVSGKPVRLWGVCPALVEVVGTGAELATIQVLNSASEVKNLAVRGAALGIYASGSLDVLLERLWVHDNADRGVDIENAQGPTRITLRDSLVEQNYDIGVFIAGSEATVESILVRDTVPIAPGLGGRGVNVQPQSSTGAPATMLLRTSLIERSQGVAVYVVGSATVEASVVRDTEPDSNGVGRGVNVEPHPTTGVPSTLLLRGSLVERSHELGVLVGGSDVTVETSVIRNAGRGLAAQAGTNPATLLLRTSLIDQSHDIGVLIEGSEATIEAAVIRNTLPDVMGGGGRAVGVQPNATSGAPSKLLLRSALLSQNHETAVFIQGSEATLESSVVADTQPDDNGTGGRGVSAQPHPTTDAPSTLRLRTSLLERNHEFGVFVVGSNAELEQSVVRDTLPNEQGGVGRGVGVQPGPITNAPSTVLLRAALIERSHESGVANFASNVTLDACLLRDTAPNLAGLFGHGLVVFSEPTPASATITGTRIHQSALAAIAAWGAHASLQRSALSCQALDLVTESYRGARATLEDLGENRCGCPEPTTTCKAASAGLEPPLPAPPP